jgi:2-keto-3-deoxygluconate permease
MNASGFWQRFKQRIRAVPAGMLLGPLFLGSLFHTFFSELLEIGSYTTALFSDSGAATLIALQLFCIGAQIRLTQLSGVLRRGGVLLLARVVSGLLIVLLFRLLAKDGFIAGISVLAAVAAVSNTNGSIFIATTSLLGKEESAASAPVLALSNGPFLTLLILGLSGASEFSWLPLFALVLPMMLGILLGNVSRKAAMFLAPGVSLTLPFIGFALGAGIDLRQLWVGGSSGVLLAVIALVIGGGIAWVLDRILNREDGAAGIAASATGANAIAVPAAIALASPIWQGEVGTAAAQISVSVIIGAIVVPLLAEWTTKLKIDKAPI